MAAIAQKNLFSWDAIEARSDLDRLRLVIDHLPDERLVQYLEVMRGHGRDDYPVRAMWHALLAGIVFQQESPESLLRELARNPSLMDACGFDPLPRQRKPKPRVVTDPATGVARIEVPPAPEPERAVPSSWNLSRFLANVIEAGRLPRHGQRDDGGLARAAYARAARLRPVCDQAPRLRRHRHRQPQHRAKGAHQW
jgi:hypothetical protein